MWYDPDPDLDRHQNGKSDPDRHRFEHWFHHLTNRSYCDNFLDFFANYQKQLSKQHSRFYAYSTPRSAVPLCQIVVLPYNTLLHAATR
jgi:hypothetical protein